MIVDKKKAASWMLRKLLIAQGKATPPLPQATYDFCQHQIRITELLGINNESNNHNFCIPAFNIIQHGAFKLA